MAGLPEIEAEAIGGRVPPLAVDQQRSESPIGNRSNRSLMEQQLQYEERKRKDAEDGQLRRWQGAGVGKHYGLGCRGGSGL